MGKALSGELSCPCDMSCYFFFCFFFIKKKKKKIVNAFKTTKLYYSGLLLSTAFVVVGRVGYLRVTGVLVPDMYIHVLVSIFKIVIVVLLFYAHGKHLRSCRDGQLPLPHFSWAGLDLLSG